MEYNLLAVVGMCGAGKSTLCQFFLQKGFSVIYFGQITLDEIKKRGLELSSENEAMVREDLRERHGMAVYAKLSLPVLKEKLGRGPVLIDGLYSYAEYLLLMSQFPKMRVIEVYADKEKRHERLMERKVRSLTKEEAVLRDKREVEELEKAPPIALSDYKLENNADQAILFSKAEELYSRLK